MATGWKHSEEAKKKIGLASIGRKPMLGRKMSKETRKRMSIKKIGSKLSEETKKKIGESHRGEKHYRWNPNREEVTRNTDGRNDSEYKTWRLEVYKRDNYKCKMLNQDCDGKIEAHHILSWRDYLELRYQINNGITLCHFHHPKKRVDEEKHSLYFSELVK